MFLASLDLGVPSKAPVRARCSDWAEWMAVGAQGDDDQAESSLKAS